MRRLIPIFLVLAVTIGVFARLPFFDFVVPDDRGNIYENPQFEKEAPVGIAAFWHHPYRGLYIPVTYTVWGILVKLSFAAGWANSLAEIPAAPFHVANLLLHLVAAGLAFHILRRLFPLASPYAAALGTLVFAIHPLQVEPVAWATGLKDILSGCLGLASILFYLRYLDENRPAQSRPVDYGAGLVALTLALFAKPSAIVVPFVVALLASGILKIPLRRVVVSLAPWLVPAAVAVIVTCVAQPGTGAAFATPLWVRPFIAAEALWFYLAKLFWPLHLNSVYDRPAQEIIAAIGSWRAMLLIVLIPIALFAWQIRKSQLRPGVTALAVWITGFLPVLGFVPFEFQRLSIVADRYNYLPLLGAALFLTWLLHNAQRRWLFIAAGIAIALLATRSHLQTRHWKDYHAHLDHGLALNPESAFFHNIDGLLHTRENRDDDAIAAFEKAVAFNPDFARCHANLGFVLKRQNRPQDALIRFARAVEIEPGNVDYRFEYGYSLFEQRKYEEALPHLEHAAALEPRMVEAHLFLALSLRYLDRLEEAVGKLENATAAGATDWRVYLELGSLYRKLDQDSMATLCFRNALESDPLPDDPRRLLQVGWLRAASPEETLRNGPRAVELANDGIRRFGNLPLLRELLAAGHAESGDFAEASRLAAKTLQDTDQSNPANTTLVSRLKRQRQLYDQEKAWRQ